MPLDRRFKEWVDASGQRFKSVSHSLKTKGRTRERTHHLNTVYPERGMRGACAAKDPEDKAQIGLASTSTPLGSGYPWRSIIEG